MEWIFVVGLGLLVFALAKKAPVTGSDPNASLTTGSLDPSSTIPANGQQPPLSPATAGGSPLGTRGNQLRNRMQYQLAQPDQKLLARDNPTHYKRRRAAQNGSEYLQTLSPNVRDSPTVTCDIPDAKQSTSDAATGTLTKL